MRINDYSSIELPKANVLSHAEKISPKVIEKVLLFLIAFLGFMGSLYVFTSNSGGPTNPNYQELALATASISDAEDDVRQAKFKKFFKIDGEKKAGELLNFTFKKDRKATRYVLDMGNGERVIITSDEFPYRFDKPGKYLLELKTISRGLITVVSTKELKIK